MMNQLFSILFTALTVIAVLQVIGTVAILRIVYNCSDVKRRRTEIKELRRLVDVVNAATVEFADRNDRKRAVRALRKLVENNCAAISNVELYNKLVSIHDTPQLNSHHTTHLTIGLPGAALYYAIELLNDDALSKSQHADIVQALDLHLTLKTGELLRKCNSLTNPKG